MIHSLVVVLSLRITAWWGKQTHQWCLDPRQPPISLAAVTGFLWQRDIQQVLMLLVWDAWADPSTFSNSSHEEPVWVSFKANVLHTFLQCFTMVSLNSSYRDRSVSGTPKHSNSQRTSRHYLESTIQKWEHWYDVNVQEDCASHDRTE